MANRYWVGNGGNWSDIAHWSATSGGVGGASVPTSVDNVYFDVNSFTLTGQIVTVDANTTCLDMDWTGALNNPSFFNNLGYQQNVYGSLTLITGMSITGGSGGSFYFLSTATGKTITTAGKTCKNFSFNGGGAWTLQDSVDISSGVFTHANGTLNTNSQTIIAAIFRCNGATTRTLTLGSSTITGISEITFTSTGLTLTPNTSTIKMTGNSTAFAGGGLTYNNVQLQGTPITITGSNTFNTLTLTAGKTVNLTSGTTQTVTSLVCNGTMASPSTLQSVTGGSPATIALPAGRYFIRHTSIQDITITGATAVTSIAGTNVSGNTGITFVTKLEVGRVKNDGSFNWLEAATGILRNISSQYTGTQRQVIINGGFSVNQRVVSGTVILAAGAYGHDRWKAGASGCTYTFVTVNNITTITITAGSLMQVIEGVNLYSGTYVLSWTGTALGRVGTGNFSASSITTFVIGGTNLNVEFNTGTLSKVQFNAGDTALPFQHKSYADNIASCITYYEKQGMGLIGVVMNSTTILLVLKHSKRVTPTITLLNTTPSITTNGAFFTGSSSTLTTYGNKDASGTAFQINGFTGLTTGQVVMSNQSDLVSIDAEL
jgi:hypothetical protein